MSMQHGPTRHVCNRDRPSAILWFMLLAAAALCSPTVVAQQPPPAPVVQPFNNGNDWVVVKPFTYTIGQTTYRITVPAGFVTDFASIPAAMRGFLSPTGQEGRAAIIHDYLYWNQPCTREQADWILRLGMIESRVSLVTRQAVYWAVRAMGDTAWQQNALERRAGLPRVVPETEIAALPALAVWSDYRQQMAQRGLHPEPQENTPPTYCAAATTIAVE